MMGTILGSLQWQGCLSTRAASSGKRAPRHAGGDWDRRAEYDLRLYQDASYLVLIRWILPRFGVPG